MDQKRPKDMSPAERSAIPVAQEYRPAFGLSGDDLIGYFQDAEGKWWREPLWM